MGGTSDAPGNSATNPGRSISKIDTIPANPAKNRIKNSRVLVLKVVCRPDRVSLPLTADIIRPLFGLRFDSPRKLHQQQQTETLAHCGDSVRAQFKQLSCSLL